MGNDSWLAVGTKRTVDPGVVEIPNEERRNAWVRAWNGFRNNHGTMLARVRGLGRLTSLLRDCGEPMRWLGAERGFEDFEYPGTARLLDLPPCAPDILHCHNLHGGYFDLRALPRLSARIPTILNVRDAWLLSGHCAFSFECERWKFGCGTCPDLSLYPAVRRDGTAHNWQRKSDIFKRSRVYVATPSQWLMDKVHESILEPAIVASRVIPNGVDTSIFSPGDKAAARRNLGIPNGSRVLTYAANGIKANVWKDFKTLKEVMRIIGSKTDSCDTILLAVGEEGPLERLGTSEIRFVPFQDGPASMVKYYRAADIYVHAAHIESFGNVLLEARACGTPVVATSVGGIPEHVNALECDWAARGVQLFRRGEATGMLTPPGDGEALAQGVLHLFENPEIMRELGENGLRDIRSRFAVPVQAQAFVGWYQEILST